MRKAIQKRSNLGDLFSQGELAEIFGLSKFDGVEDYHFTEVNEIKTLDKVKSISFEIYSRNVTIDLRPIQEKDAQNPPQTYLSRSCTSGRNKFISSPNTGSDIMDCGKSYIGSFKANNSIWKIVPLPEDLSDLLETQNMLWTPKLHILMKTKPLRKDDGKHAIPIRENIVGTFSKSLMAPRSNYHFQHDRYKRGLDPTAPLKFEVGVLHDGNLDKAEGLMDQVEMLMQQLNERIVFDILFITVDDALASIQNEVADSDALLHNLCDSSLENDEHTDFRIYLSRKKLKLKTGANSSTEVDGLAFEDGACWKQFNCILARYDINNSYAQIAHLLGHSLNLRHTESGNGSEAINNVMKAEIDLSNPPNEWVAESKKNFSDLWVDERFGSCFAEELSFAEICEQQLPGSCVLMYPPYNISCQTLFCQTSSQILAYSMYRADQNACKRGLQEVKEEEKCIELTDNPITPHNDTKDQDGDLIHIDHNSNSTTLPPANQTTITSNSNNNQTFSTTESQNGDLVASDMPTQPNTNDSVTITPDFNITTVTVINSSSVTNTTQATSPTVSDSSNATNNPANSTAATGVTNTTQATSSPPVSNNSNATNNPTNQTTASMTNTTQATTSPTVNNNSDATINPTNQTTNTTQATTSPTVSNNSNGTNNPTNQTTASTTNTTQATTSPTVNNNSDATNNPANSTAATDATNTTLATSSPPVSNNSNATNNPTNQTTASVTNTQATTVPTVSNNSSNNANTTNNPQNNATATAVTNTTQETTTLVVSDNSSSSPNGTNNPSNQTTTSITNATQATTTATINNSSNNANTTANLANNMTASGVTNATQATTTQTINNSSNNANNPTNTTQTTNNPTNNTIVTGTSTNVTQATTSTNITNTPANVTEITSPLPTGVPMIELRTFMDYVNSLLNNWLMRI